MLFLYIHGFNSSPASFKAQCFEKFLNENYPDEQFIAPELSDLPARAMATLEKFIKQYSEYSSVALIGSSLGGFYATYLAQKFDLRAVLVNPAVNPQVLLVDYLGKNKNFYTGEEYEFTREHISQLDEISIRGMSSPNNLMVLLQTGDEVLDYQLAEKKYAESQLIIEQGGDHSFQNFARHCEGIYQFLLGARE